MTGMGVTELLENISDLIPANKPAENETLSGVVFKIEREPSGEKIAYVRVFSGRLHVRKYVHIQRDEAPAHKEKIKKYAYFITEMRFKLLSFLAENFAKCGD